MKKYRALFFGCPRGEFERELDASTNTVEIPVDNCIEHYRLIASEEMKTDRPTLFYWYWDRPTWSALQMWEVGSFEEAVSTLINGHNKLAESGFKFTKRPLYIEITVFVQDRPAPR